jgi:hypothetical protein
MDDESWEKLEEAVEVDLIYWPWIRLEWLSKTMELRIYGLPSEFKPSIFPTEAKSVTAGWTEGQAGRNKQTDRQTDRHHFSQQTNISMFC